MIEIGYLGPIGTYSHLVAEKRYGTKAKLIPFPTIMDVCEFTSGHKNRKGIIPIENSSGGTIYETVDILLNNKPKIFIDEELSLKVRLALIGRKGENIINLYSHFAPLEHCSAWIKKNLPKVQRHAVTSTAIAAQKTSEDTGAAALGSRRLAAIYGLEIIHYPVSEDVPNITTFLAISGSRSNLHGSMKTTVAARLPNIPGSLCDFLDTFRKEKVNLSRILSRPIRGSHREYAFLADVQGGTGMAKVQRAISAAKKVSVLLRIAGSYPSRQPYSS